MSEQSPDESLGPKADLPKITLKIEGKPETIAMIEAKRQQIVESEAKQNPEIANFAVVRTTRGHWKFSGTIKAEKLDGLWVELGGPTDSAAMTKLFGPSVDVVKFVGPPAAVVGKIAVPNEAGFFSGYIDLYIPKGRPLVVTAKVIDWRIGVASKEVWYLAIESAE